MRRSTTAGQGVKGTVNAESSRREVCHPCTTAAVRNLLKNKNTRALRGDRCVIRLLVVQLVLESPHLQSCRVPATAPSSTSHFAVHVGSASQKSWLLCPATFCPCFERYYMVSCGDTPTSASACRISLGALQGREVIASSPSVYCLLDNGLVQTRSPL